jgi:TonB-linked SusC/RagA family outer membrane protein
VRTSTSDDGAFSLNVPAGVTSLEVTFVGFKTSRIALGASNTVSVSLEAAASDLDAVVVTGYATKKKADFTGSVARVQAKEIEQVPIGSFEQILQGRAPGLYIASGSGQPGAAARVNIRGVGSINGGNDPLYILDGVPIEGAVFRTLNPNDFATVDVLKDAAGAGLYGSRGANGVIVITSKKGAVGKMKFQYRGQAGYSEPPNQWNLSLMNTSQRLEYEEKFLGPAGLAAGFPGWDWSLNNPANAALSDAQKANLTRQLDSVRQINTDWADIMFRRGTFTQHEVSASGGTDKIQVYNSLSLYRQEGVIHRSNLNRYTYRGNVDFKTDRLTGQVRAFAGWSQQNGIESEAGVALANPIAAAYLELPYRRFQDDNGKTLTGAGRVGANAYDRLFTTTSGINQFKGTLGITLQYKIWDGLSFKTTNGVDWRNNNSYRWIDPLSFAGSQVAIGAQGSYNEGNAENLQLISTTGFAYNKIIKDDHALNLNLMYEGIRNKARNNGFTGFGINPKLPQTPAAITPGSAANNLIPQVGGGKTISGLSSAFLVGDYTFKRKYTLSGSLRNDAPSQVPETNRDNWFWTLGANWNVMAEKFMENQSFLQDLRVRASYGESGNTNGFTSDFGYISTYSPGSYAGIAGIVPSSPGNLDYRLESQIMTNIGIDFSFWKRRARVQADWYNKESQNLFIAQPLSRTTGFTSNNTNVGSMRNRGLDFKVDVDVIAKRDLIVTVGVNGGFLKNKILDIGNNTEIPTGTSILRPGIPFGSHFTVGFLGVDPNSGLPIYTDKFGNPTNEYSAANNKTGFGTFLPSFTGGATLDITYKGFSLSTLFTTAQNVSRFNNESFFYETTNSNQGFNKRVEMLNSWLKPGDVTEYQRMSAQRQFSSKDVRDASFIRWRNLQMGYNFNTKSGKIINGFRLWAQGQNIWTWTKWTGFDPEESNNIATYEFPNPKTYTIGLDVNF